MVLGRKQMNADFIKRASGTATHYGFVPLDEIQQAVRAMRSEKGSKLTVIPNSLPAKAVDMIGSELSKTLRFCGEQGILSRKQPTLFFHTSFDLARKSAGVKDMKTFSFGLHAYGANQSVGEAVILQAALSILEEIGMDDLTVYVNSVGDRDSKARFLRELGTSLKKRVSDLPPQAETLLKEDPLETLLYLVKKKHPIVEELPRSVEFLSSASRRNFREVLEQLEAAGIRFELDEYLIGSREYYSETIFDIRKPSELPDVEHDLIVRGGRIDELPKRMFKMPLPAVGIVFSLLNPGAIKDGGTTPRMRQPKVYFVHLGTEAKLHSLDVIETLRRAHIPFRHSIADSGFSEQVASAERLGVPYLVIMGQKEAVERSVIVRNIDTRAQETVSIERLPTYFKTSRV